MTTPFSTIFQHQDFILISKAPGISFHGEDNGRGLFFHLRQTFGDKALFPVHRLDKITSGLLIVATSKESAHRFSEMFSSRTIDKYYLAIADRKPRKKQGLICGDMAPSRRGTWKLLPSKKSPATTQFFSSALGACPRIATLLQSRRNWPIFSLIFV